MNKEKNNSSEADEIKSYNPLDYNARRSLKELMYKAPIPENELMNNISLFIDRRNLSRILFIDELYKKFMHLHGNIVEFGTRYGPNLALFTSMRGIYEPFNHNRKIIAFDTFEGFANVDIKDENSVIKWAEGDYSVPIGYEGFLGQVLDTHENMAPLENIKKYELIKGDASLTVPAYLKERQETIIACAYFDFDIYKPTKDCLEAIRPYLTKGAVIGFDEINTKDCPGETAALRECLGTKNYKILQSRYRANAGYFIFE